MNQSRPKLSKFIIKDFVKFKYDLRFLYPLNLYAMTSPVMAVLTKNLSRHKKLQILAALYAPLIALYVFGIKFQIPRYFVSLDN